MVTDEQFLEAWERSGHSPNKTAKLLGVNERTVYRRRDAIEQRMGQPVRSGKKPWRPVFENVKNVGVENGHVVVFSDGHFWPGERTVAFEALLKITKKIKPRVLIANGDMVDGASTNRHDPNGWSENPSVLEEIETVAENLHELRLAAPRGTECLWNIGNHDLNFERRLCTSVPQFAKMPMMRLQDHFPDWEMQWATEINDDVIVKHRWHNGIHAGYNNALKSGRTIVTGHLHRLLITPWGGLQWPALGCRHRHAVRRRRAAVRVHRIQRQAVVLGLCHLDFSRWGVDATGAGRGRRREGLLARRLRLNAFQLEQRQGRDPTHHAAHQPEVRVGYRGWLGNIRAHVPEHQLGWR